MLGFLIKKTFFDTWDNLFQILLINIGFYIPIGLIVIFSPLAGIGIPDSSIPIVISIPACFILLSILFIYSSGSSALVKDFVNYKTINFHSFWLAIKEGYQSCLICAAINAIYFILCRNALIFYSNLEQLILSTVATIILGWITFSWLLAMQFFFPVHSQLDKNPRKIFKKMLLLFIDNTKLHVFLAFGSIIILLISLITGGILPGIGAVFIFQNSALKLILFKYDYLEENPTVNRNKIPWDALLIDERNKIGKRTLRGMIFPWKE